MSGDNPFMVVLESVIQNQLVMLSALVALLGDGGDDREAKDMALRAMVDHVAALGRKMREVDR